MVILGHAKFTSSPLTLSYKINDIVIYSDLGVKIFFFLSGFLITTLLIKEHISKNTIDIRLFFIKRVLRIFPVLYLYLVVLFAFDQFFDLKINTINFLSAAFFFTNFVNSKDIWFTIHTWSLSVEEQFYILWPTIFLIFNRKISFFCVSLILIIPFLRIFWHFNPNLTNITLKPFLDPAETLFSGALLATLCFKGAISSNQKIWKVRGLCYMVIGIYIILTFMFRSGMGSAITIPFRSLITNCLIGLIILHSLINRGSTLFLFLNHKIIAKIGILSYSLYLWQQLFIVPTDFYNGKILWTFFPINLILTFTTAYISYHCFEVHFLNLKNKLISKSNKV